MRITGEVGPEVASPRRSEDERVFDWRLACLRAAGFDDDDSATLARERSVDLHVALDLVRRGCPPETAVRILT